MERNQFTYENELNLCGMITNVFSNPRSTIFTVSCGFRGMQTNEDGKLERNVMLVEFFEDEGLYYAEKFKRGSRVIVKAVAQNVRDIYNMNNYLTFWGIKMEAEDGRNITRVDVNDIKLTGKIQSARAYDNGWVKIRIQTVIENERVNVNNPDFTLKNKYSSITPVRVRIGRNAEKVCEEKLTTGTWVTLDGHVYGRLKKDIQNGRETTVRVENIIANNMSIIGQIQKAEVRQKEKDIEQEIVPEEVRNEETSVPVPTPVSKPETEE